MTNRESRFSSPGERSFSGKSSSFQDRFSFLEDIPEDSGEHTHEPLGDIFSIGPDGFIPPTPVIESEEEEGEPEREKFLGDMLRDVGVPTGAPGMSKFSENIDRINQFSPDQLDEMEAIGVNRGQAKVAVDGNDILPLGYNLQELGKGVASLGDIATVLIDATPGVGYAKHLLGQQINKTFYGTQGNEPYRIEYGAIQDTYETAVKQARSFLGGPEELFEAENAFQRGQGLLFENLGAGSVIKLGQTAVRGARGLGTRFLDEFTASEVSASIGGAIVGGAASNLGYQEPAKEQYTYLGNLVGSLYGGLRYAPSYQMLKKFKDVVLREPESLESLSNRVIWDELSQLVPDHALPEAIERMDMVRAIRQIPGAEEFTPSFGAIVGDSSVMAFQRKIDADNVEKASKLYAKNKQILETLINRYGTDQRGRFYPQIRETMNEVYAQRSEVIRNLNEQITDIKENMNLYGRSEATTSPGFNAEEARTQLIVAERSLKELVDEAYAVVDPDNLVSFKGTQLNNLIDQTKNEVVKSFRTQKFNPNDPGKHLIEEIDDIIESNIRPLLPGTSTRDSLGALIREGKPEGSMLFNDLVDVRKSLDSIVRDAKSIPGGTQATVYANKLARTLDEFMDTQLSTVGGDVGTNYVYARQAYREHYLPLFVQESSIATQLLAKYPQGDFVVKADDLMQQVWREGARPKDIDAQKIVEIWDKASEVERAGGNETVIAAAREAFNYRVQEHALASLNRSIRNATDPSTAFSKWVQRNEVNLINFPHIKPAVDKLGQLISYDINTTNNLQDLVAINRTRLSQYLEVDPERYVKGLLSMSEKEADTAIKEMMFGLGVRSPYMSLPTGSALSGAQGIADWTSIDKFIQSLRNTSPDLYEKAIDFRQGLSQEAMSQIIRNVSKPTAEGGLDANKLSRIFRGEDSGYSMYTLRSVLTPKDYNDLKLLERLSRVTNEGISPASKIELDALLRLESTYGISIPSVLNRMYASSLGKVGKFFIVSDLSVKLLRAKHIYDVKRKVSEVAYDLDLIEDVIRHKQKLMSGEETAIAVEVLDQVQGIKAKLNKYKDRIISGKISVDDFVKTLEDPSMIAKGWKLEQYLDSIRDDEGADFARLYALKLEQAFPEEAPMTPEELDAWGRELELRMRKDLLSEEVDVVESSINDLVQNLEDGKTYSFDRQTGEWREEEPEEELDTDIDPLIINVTEGNRAND